MFIKTIRVLSIVAFIVALAILLLLPLKSQPRSRVWQQIIIDKTKDFGGVTTTDSSGFVRSLQINSPTFTGKDFLSIASLRYYIKLESIDLAGTQIDNLVASSLLEIETLRHLRISNTKIDGDIIPSIVKSKIETLAIDGTLLVPEEIEEIIEQSSIKVLQCDCQQLCKDETIIKARKAKIDSNCVESICTISILRP